MKKPQKVTGFVPSPGKRRAAAPPGPAPTSPDAIVDRVRACYCIERSRWESIKAGRPIAYLPPAVYDGRPALKVEGDEVVEKAVPSAWREFILWCESCKIRPESYIQAQFDCLSVYASMAPEPRQLKAERYVQVWRGYIRTLVQRLETAFRIQTEIAATEIAVKQAGGMDYYDACASTLCTRSLQLSPLFRYCLAKKVGGPRFQKIAERFEAEAVMQFERHRVIYKRTWTDMLPVGFAGRSKKIYPHLSRTL